MIICGIMEGNFRLSELKILVECIVKISYYHWAPIDGGGGDGGSSDPLLSDPPNGNFFIVSSCARAGLGRRKYKAIAITTQIPVNKMKLVSSLFDANGPSNLCTGSKQSISVHADCD